MNKYRFFKFTSTASNPSKISLVDNSGHLVNYGGSFQCNITSDLRMYFIKNDGYGYSTINEKLLSDYIKKSFWFMDDKLCFDKFNLYALGEI